MRLATKEQRISSRRVPAGAHVVTANDQCAAYCYQLGGKYVALCFRGTAGKAEVWNSYRNADDCFAAISTWLVGVDRSLAVKAERSAAKKAWANPLTVGTVASAYGFGRWRRTPNQPGRWLASAGRECHWNQSGTNRCTSRRCRAKMRRT